MISLRGFMPFKSAEEALENINDVSEGVMSAALRNCLDQNMPAAKKEKKSKHALGVADHKLGSMIQEDTGIACVCNDLTAELIRGCRLHLSSLLSQLKGDDWVKAQLGLAHSYSRCKVKFDVNRADKHIIQSIAILDTLDKDINTFAMRVREWYSYHFPELIKVVADNYQFARLVLMIGRRDSLNTEMLPKIEEVTMDATKAQAVLDASKVFVCFAHPPISPICRTPLFPISHLLFLFFSHPPLSPICRPPLFSHLSPCILILKHSMGMDISEIDLINIRAFAERVIKLSEYRKSLQDYLHSKMGVVAPNLQALIGDSVGARLISHAGSLTNLSKYPASTVQILGAEKALFRALKTRGNTPKYGLIFHSSFIGRAAAKNKGRISRYLANKCSIACRIDNFSETPTSKYGTKLNEQVEQRLRFYDSGEAPKKNVDAMQEVLAELRAEGTIGEPKKKDKKDKGEKKKKDKGADEDEKKKGKKEKRKSEGGADEKPKKKKKKDK